jgi:hypothetical protein
MVFIVKSATPVDPGVAGLLGGVSDRLAETELAR